MPSGDSPFNPFADQAPKEKPHPPLPQNRPEQLPQETWFKKNAPSLQQPAPRRGCHDCRIRRPERINQLFPLKSGPGSAICSFQQKIFRTSSGLPAGREHFRKGERGRGSLFLKGCSWGCTLAAAPCSHLETRPTACNMLVRSWLQYSMAKLLALALQVGRRSPAHNLPFNGTKAGPHDAFCC